MKHLVITVALVLLVGCASLDESECLTADWHLIGYEDGANGKSRSQIGEHRRACAKYGVVPDHQAYQAGHSKGVREFCTPSRGFQLGKNGDSYTGICPGELEGEFLDGYDLGKLHYSYTSRISKYRSDIYYSEDRIEKLRKKVRSKEAELIGDDTVKSKRSELLSEIKRHQREIGELKATIITSRKKLAVAESDYSRLPEPPY